MATLGAVQVDRDELQRQLQALPPQARAQLKDNRAGLDQWLRARLAEKALIEQARVQGWQDKPEVKRAFQAAQEQILMQSYLESVSRAPDDYPTEADLASAYERAKPQLAQPALYRVSQIFLPPRWATPRPPPRASRRRNWSSGPRRPRPISPRWRAPFAGCQQPRTGRRHRLLPLAQLTPEMRPAVEQLKTGDVSAPVQSAAGFHILKLADLRPASVTPFDQVKGELRRAAQPASGTCRARLSGGLAECGNRQYRWRGPQCRLRANRGRPGDRRRRRERQALRRRSLCPRWRGAWMTGCCRRWARLIRPSASRARRP